MKKPKGVELYFIIYIATIVSFFTIEGELRTYKEAQKDILYQVSKETATSLIHVFTVDKSDMKKERLQFNITGDFDPESFQGSAVFSDVYDNQYVFPLKAVESEPGIYLVDTTKKTFEHNNVTHYVSLSLEVMPNISDSTVEVWGRNYGDIKIARKIKDLIQERGTLRLVKDIAFSVVPEYGTLPPFSLVTEDRETAIKGIRWTHNLVSSGALDANDVRIQVIGGGKYKIDNSNFPVITLSGIADRKRNITIIGQRLSDNTSKTVSFSLDVIKPILRFDNNRTFCLNEPIVYKGSLESFPDENINLLLRGDFFSKPKKIRSHILDIPGFSEEGVIIVDITVKGNRTPVLTDTIKVKKPAPPKVELLPRNGNTMKVKITSFCTGNTLDEPIKNKGIYKIIETDRKELPGKTEYYYDIPLKRPKNPKIIQVEFSFDVYDSFNGHTSYTQKVNWKR